MFGKIWRFLKRAVAYPTVDELIFRGERQAEKLAAKAAKKARKKARKLL